VSLAVVLSLLLLTLATHVGVGAGIAWDALNGIGVVALAVLTALHVETIATSRETARSAAATIIAHTRLAYLALAAIMLHALGLLLTDRVTLEYLSLMSPLYMVAAIAAVPILVWLMVASSAPRRRRFSSPTEFRLVHRLAAAVLLLLAAWHVLGTGHYLGQRPQQIAAIAMLGSCLAVPRTVAKWCAKLPPIELGTASTLLIALLAAFVAARNA